VNKTANKQKTIFFLINMMVVMFGIDYYSFL
jgi:hypothetical protein